MKTIFRWLIKAGLFAATCSSLFLASCGNKSEDKAAAPVTYYKNGNSCYSNTGQPVQFNLCANSPYYLQGNICYANGTQVDMSFCGMTANGYYINAQGLCVNNQGQQAPNQAYCNNNTNPYNNNPYNYGQQQTQCYGQYSYPTGWGYVYCQGYNCSGQTLRNMSGQTVTCM